MPDPIYNEEGFEIDEGGELVLDDKDNPIPKPEDKDEEEEEEDDRDAKIFELEKYIEGLKGDTIRERQRRRISEEELAALKTEKAGGGKGADEEDDLEPMTRGEFKQEKKRLKAEVRKEMQADKDVSDMVEARADDKNFSKIEKMALEVMQTDPEMEAAYKATKNIAKFYYKIAKQHPDYTADLQQAAGKKIVKKIQKNNKKVSTGTGAGKGSAGDGGDEDFDDMTIEEYQKLPMKQRLALPESVRERILGADD